MERPLAIAGRESPGYRLWPPLRLLPACRPPRRMGRGSCWGSGIRGRIPRPGSLLLTIAAL